MAQQSVREYEQVSSVRIEREYAELTLEMDDDMGMIGLRFNHRDLLPDECCDRPYCARCGNVPMTSDEWRGRASYS